MLENLSVKEHCLNFPHVVDLIYFKVAPGHRHADADPPRLPIRFQPEAVDGPLPTALSDLPSGSGVRSRAHGETILRSFSGIYGCATAENGQRLSTGGSRFERLLLLAGVDLPIQSPT
jgi:hypothetical protein